MRRQELRAAAANTTHFTTGAWSRAMMADHDGFCVKDAFLVGENAAAICLRVRVSRPTPMMPSRSRARRRTAHNRQCVTPSLIGGRLPEFHLVSFWIDDPGKLTVLGIVHFIEHGAALFA